MSTPEERMSPEELKRFNELHDEYIRQAHGVQTGIAMRLELDKTFGTPKDLRVGLDTSKADMGGLVALLISKGIFTDIEYMEAIVQSMREERARWEANIGELMGREITLL